MTEENVTKPMSSSNEDLSEYTDADESISAPTEFLAEVGSTDFLKVEFVDKNTKRTVIIVVLFPIVSEREKAGSNLCV